jgi:hypothetical protein
LSNGDALVVALVAVVVLAHVQFVAEVWLNVVLNPAFAKVRSAAAFCRLLQIGEIVEFGISAATSARNVGADGPAEVGPAHTVLAVCVGKVYENAGVVVAVATDTLIMASILPELTLVTVPVPAGRSAATSARNVGVAAAPVVGPANTKFAVWVNSVGVKVPAALATFNAELKITPSPANCPANTLLVVGSVSVGVAALAGAVIVYFPDAVLDAMAIDPVDVPGMPRTGAMVYPGAAAPVVAFPNTVPPAALVNAKVRAGVVVAVATLVVNRGLRFPALKLVTVPVPAGKSAATNARNVGAAAVPVVGPAHIVLAVCVVNAKEIAGVVVGVATDTVAIASILPELTLVTVPVPAVAIAASAMTKFSAIIGSMLLRENP